MTGKVFGANGFMINLVFRAAMRATDTMRVANFDKKLDTSKLSGKFFVELKVAHSSCLSMSGEYNKRITALTGQSHRAD